MDCCNVIHSRYQRDGAKSSIPARRKSGSLEASHPCGSVVLEIIELPVRTMEPNRMRNAVDCTLTEAVIPPIRSVGCWIGVPERKGAATRKADAWSVMT
jgi:hypothetical protein